MSFASGYLLLLAFGAAMIVITFLGSRTETYRKTQVGFLAAGRNVPWTLGAFSIAVSWIWAPALFVSVQEAFQQGIPGIFWFTFPNILCLFIMAPLALRVREYLPEGYTQPEWIRRRFDERTHKMYLIPFFWYQLMAVTVQLYVGGSIFHLLTGVPLQAVMIIILLFTLAYSAISGMRASIITDFLQYAMIILGGLLVLPWTIWSAGGLGAVLKGIGGITGQHTSIFDPGVAFSFGIITTIGLISGVLSDQQHWQRAFAIEKSHLRISYIVGGVLFGIVPLSLAALGFLAANPAVGVSLPQGADPSMIGILVVAKFLPAWAVAAFAVMLLAALCSVLDSGMVAAASLYAVNCCPYTSAERSLLNKRFLRESLDENDTIIQAQLDRKVIRRSRIGMIGISAAGLAVALGVIYTRFTKDPPINNF
ncbi:hypothetical protein HY213_05760 [Candidatus Peregrinibacteria bacterium]|nr:hypothetical protein [Candidatus Peregrinibacteria bacterium]